MQDTDTKNIDKGFDELGVYVPLSAKHYADSFYGIYQDIQRQLEFKLGEVCSNRITNQIIDALLYAVKTGKQVQREIDNAKLVEMQRELDQLIKKDYKASQERKRKLQQ